MQKRALAVILLVIALLALLPVACQEPGQPEPPAGAVQSDIGVLDEPEATSTPLSTPEKAYFTEILSVQGSTPTPRPTRTPTPTATATP